MLFVVKMTQYKEVKPAQLSQRFNNIKVIGMAGCYKKLNKLILKCKWSPEEEEKGERACPTNIKTWMYSKTAWYWHRDRQISSRESGNMPIYINLLYNRGCIANQWVSEGPFNEWCWYNWLSIWKKVHCTPSSIPDR